MAKVLETRGWNPAKVKIFRDQFMRFLDYVEVNSKELGQIKLGDHIYRAQQRFLDGVFEGLSRDIHDFKCLKSRQLGLSTISRALTLFWCGVHDGLKGYMVFDTDQHKEEARIELVGMLRSLPKNVKFPRIRRENRYLLELDNGSMINFASAGVRKGKSSGVLGRSSGINFVHASELCSWDNTEGLEAFKNSLAEDFPNRLYLWESTARGFNDWHEMWMQALKDETHQVCIFLGWWSKDNQQIPQNHPDFARYGYEAPSAEEIKKIKAVRDQYGWDVTIEQLAWIRRKMNPTAEAEGDAPADYSGDPLKIQEVPWTAEEAFQQTGATFFDPENLTQITNRFVSGKFKAYTYSYGTDFIYCKPFPSPNARSVELKVWEEPDEDGVYVIASDPAFGASEFNDRSATQVLRCYADGLDQVAEYAWPLVNSRQFAWVIASLLGWYAGKTATVYNILEINGPGEAVWNELQSLKAQLAHGYYEKETEERGLRRILSNVHNYIYTRSDSMTAGQVWQLKTNGQLKISLMERLRDFVSNEMIRIRSLDTIEEMKSITREGDSIAAQGSKKDDRVLSLAFGVRCWEDRIRRSLTAQRRTRETEQAKKRLTIRDQASLYNSNMLENFFAVKQHQRRMDLSAWRRAAWRSKSR